jgi:hypothetical protein
VFRALALRLLCAGSLAVLLATQVLADASSEGIEVPTPDASGAKPNAPPPVESSWFDRLPFIPVPDIGSDPDSGTTVGILPVWLKTDEQHAIRRIIAPDIVYNPFFGYGIDARLYSYNSDDEQWSIEGGAKERVERDFDAEYQKGRLRLGTWSYTASLIYSRDGTPRFFGIGNNSPAIAETNYTNSQELAQIQIGRNFTPTWQLLYTLRVRTVHVLPGTLARIASIESRFADILGIGTNSELLNRVSLVYDTRDNLTAPRRGMQWVVYGGVATRSGVHDRTDAVYDETGVDARGYLPVSPHTVLAAHMSLRYLPSARRLPFWALSSIGGGESVIGGEQPLRGYGAGRFYDRNAFSASAELRHTVWSFDAMSTHVDIELTPFVDVGHVFSHSGTWPIEDLHKVGGIGFRGVARPSVVGFVDVGYGNEGVAVFTGINYPF